MTAAKTENSKHPGSPSGKKLAKLRAGNAGTTAADVPATSQVNRKEQNLDGVAHSLRRGAAFTDV
jgi:hypothetical protein